jgi:hypothetical protein
MEILKVKVVREKYTELVNGNTNKLTVNLTQALTKKVSVNGTSTKEEMIADKNLIKKFDALNILCMLSSDNITIPIKEMTLTEEGLSFVLDSIKNDSIEKEYTRDTVKKVQKEDGDFEKRIYERIERFCKNSKVYTVNGPRVAIHPNGVVFGTGKTLPILNDVRFYVDIEKQKFYFTYDMTEDEFLSQLDQFLKNMLFNNFVFIWKNKCEYKEVDGKRFLILYYTTRRYINQTKKLL